MLESPDMVDGTSAGVRLFLASNSPRRRELLSLGGWEYGILSSTVDETPLMGEDGMDYVTRLARCKAENAANQAKVGGVIIAADTTVIGPRAQGKNKIMGKPRDAAEAVEMLRSLRDQTYQVHTALAILDGRSGAKWSDICTTNVSMRSYSDQEIEDYVASGDPIDKAGAYAIQHAGFHPVEGLDGCFANVMGLPLCHLKRSIAHFGLTPQVDIPQACQAAIGYDCPVYHQILMQRVSAQTGGW